MSSFYLQDLCKSHLDQVLMWRNQTHIRNMMYTDRFITKSEHEQWCQNVLSNDQMIVKLLFQEDQPLGLVQFTQIHEAFKRCHWGFYVEESDAPKGTGTILGLLALDYIFIEQQMRKVCAEVIEENTLSYYFHKKLGFKEEGRFKEHIMKDGVSMDVTPMALFYDHWQKARLKLLEEL
ncbi:UDP-4-amino-4,6-dideoxy-N-acetyl-beta-L-altrosamine N-acetyltransferase [Alkalibacillus haloalkaliphilus]|uniref:UDP-4-amino-4, 6-dideoxy-N-acetyl-beta-L-altrosamine N-acetyltransferase n=1 Tax=Alkalibacillus haloalkaliphilus TaxID=94136 RepID=UPI0029356BD9|nr:UDP-4-amino-4,6-dideoxy-N-acetyl-beta-L-altrosamine N-acetyltransferase [Alkalibacillus haloalkaliphilus]MDV2582911.1 UDP-4-amino-4,6-dideoxy-N-acetyl-beta-L-altrosamine N-acetyltransferase [Alkalibacillus haloalkaliphilus]